MASPRRMAAAAPAVLLLLLLLVATGTSDSVRPSTVCFFPPSDKFKVVEARTCESQSHKFKGACFSDTYCAGVCRTENFPGGVERKCYCRRDC